MKREATYEFEYDVNYYLMKIISDEVADHKIDPPEEQCDIIRQNILGFHY